MKTSFEALAAIAAILLGPTLARPDDVAAGQAPASSMQPAEAPGVQAQPDAPAPPSPQPTEPPPTSPPQTPPAPPPQQQAQPPATSAPAGQWVYTYQYGWVWMPYGDAYTYVPPDGYGQPYTYAYYPVVGWTWIVAPWVWGWGPWPYFGVYGAWGFGWYGHGWWRYPWRWHYVAPYRGVYPYRGGVYPAHRGAPYGARGGMGVVGPTTAPAPAPSPSRGGSGGRGGGHARGH